MNEREYTEDEQCDAEKAAFDFVCGDLENIQLVISEHVFGYKIYELLAAIMICQEKYREEHMDNIRELIVDMLEPKIEARTQIELGKLE